MLRATTACFFSTSQLPKVVRTWCVFYILTWKCVSRHNGVQLFISHLASWLRTRRFSEPTFRPSGATNHWKNTVFHDFPTFSRICIFFLLIFSLLTLLTSAFQLSILSEVSLLNFLRQTNPSNYLPPGTARIRKAIPVNLPLVVGKTSPTALAAPVALGIMLQDAARPPRQSCVGANDLENRETGALHGAQELHMTARTPSMWNFKLGGICMYVCLSVCLSVCMSVCLSVCLYVCMYVCIHIYIYILTPSMFQFM